MQDYGPMPKIRKMIPRVTREKVEPVWMREERAVSPLIIAAGRIASSQAIAIGKAGGIRERRKLEHLGIAADLKARTDMIYWLDEWWLKERGEKGFMRPVTVEGLDGRALFRQLIVERGLK